MELVKETKQPNEVGNILNATPIDPILEEKAIRAKDKEQQMIRYSLDRDYLIQQEVERLQRKKDRTIHIREW